MMEIEKYLTDISEADEGGYIEFMVDDIMDKITTVLRVTTETFTLVEQTLTTVINIYRDMKCSFVPIYHEDIQERVRAIGSYILMKILKHASLISNITAVDGKLKLLNLNSGTVDKMTYDTTEGDNSTKSTEYGKVINKAGTSGGYDMSENSPINGDLERIDTPDNKRETRAYYNNSDTSSGEDIVSDNRTATKNGTDTRDITSPNDYKIYMELAYEYNIYHILLDIVKYTVWEYNRVR